MGEAKLRGTFEQRKKAAIAAGRIKKPAQVLRYEKWQLNPWGFRRKGPRKAK
jgi:hypothetical protein